MCALSTWTRVAASSRLHNLIPICQQHRNPLKSAISARRGSVRTASGSIQLPELCAGRFGLPAAKPSRGIGWYGRIASPPSSNNAARAAKSAKSSQLCGDANYSRVHAEGESLHSTHTTVLPTPCSLPFSARNIKGWNGIVGIFEEGRPCYAYNHQGTPSSYDVVLISKVWVNISQFSLSREDWYVRYTHRELWDLKDYFYYYLSCISTIWW